MSQLWKQLLRGMDASVTDALTLGRVTTNRTADNMTICLNSTKLLQENEYDRVCSSFIKGFPDAKVHVRISYPTLKDSALQDMGKTMQYVTGMIAREHPAVKPYLLWGDKAAWKLEGDRLQVGVMDAMGLSYLQKNAIAQRIEQLMQELFTVNCHVSMGIMGDTEARLARIAEARQKEENRMAEVMQATQKKVEEKPAQPRQIMGKPIGDDPIPMNEITEDSGRIIVKGEVINPEFIDLKNGAGKICTFALCDSTGSVGCKAFIGGKRMAADNPEGVQKAVELATEGIADGKWLTVRGEYTYDDYKHEMLLMCRDIVRSDKPTREDNALEKRVELHLHTQMSAMDGMASASDLINQAAAWGHKAIAVTDHGVVQAFPEAFGAAKKAGIKLIPGCEGYLIDDRCEIVKEADNRVIANTPFVILDVETTGLNGRTDEIIEIGAVRFENGEEVAEFSQLINPMRPIPEKIVELTGISDQMVRECPQIQDVIGDFVEFCKGAVLCAHNADFDLQFITRAFVNNGYQQNAPVLDTLALSRNVLKEQKSHKLGAICKTLGISLKDAHRAVHDARATALCLMKMLQGLKNVETLEDLNNAFSDDNGTSHHIIILAKSQVGITNLYRLVSEGHLHHFYRTPRIPRSLITKWREGLIIGSACEAGELYRAMVGGADWNKLKKIASFYDYLEIQPIGNNEFMVREGTVPDEEALQDLNRKIVKLGAELQKPVVATGDVHFKEPDDAIYRAILMTAKGFEDADQQAPLYFRTTDDMLQEFAYLGKEKAKEVVITAPNAIADMVEEGLTVFIKHPEGKPTFQPYWDYAENDIRSLTENTAKSIYGDPMPDIVCQRLDKELGSIIGYGFSTLYDIAVKLVQKSLSDGYIVGSRGSVGSSLVAYMTGITEVNALPPHYVCPNCKHSEFDVPAQYACGIDLPEKNCPVCGTNMRREGFNIPFEVFLGFKGDKVPDIDLNFSGEYQSRAQNYVKELFGSENVFRAGTIGSVAEKTAYGYVLKYLELKGKTASNAEKERLARGMTGVKRTTGQHPAGMVVLPQNYEIYQFTPIQHPADDMQSETITTHFDFNSMHDVLVKVDVLGHDDPTMLRKLQDLTGIAPLKVPLDDPKIFKNILSLFKGPEALGVTKEQINSPTGTLGIPEFGTRFVQQMLVETQPTTMEELVRISGLSHGTDVWTGNIQEIVREGIAPLKDCICTRDDIMNQLIGFGCEKKMAFTIMESVRKGKGLKPEMEEAMIACHTPEWFINSCKKIGYMFPKSHAVAYVTSALRIAYFKIYYPKEYYACYLKRNIESFDGSRMIASLPAIKGRLEEINAMERAEKEKKSGEAGILEILVEMLSRGIEFMPISLYESDAENFRIVDGKILPPFVSLPGLGSGAARNLVEIRDEGPFISKDDMKRRKISPSLIEMLENVGALKDLPESSQVSFFE